MSILKGCIAFGAIAFQSVVVSLPAIAEPEEKVVSEEEADGTTETALAVSAKAEKVVDADGYTISVTTSEEMEGLKVKMSDKWIEFELNAETDAGYTYTANAKFVMHDGREGKIFIKEDTSSQKVGTVTFRDAGEGFSGVATQFEEASEPVRHTTIDRSGAMAAQSGSNDPYLNEINRVRAQRGLRPIAFSSHYQSVSARNNATVTGRNKHTYNTGYQTWASYSSPSRAVNMWLNSPGHRKIILNPNIRQGGVAVSRSGVTFTGR